MEFDQVKELINKAKRFASKEVGKELAERFEEFFELHHQKDHFIHNPEFMERLDQAHRKFWTTYFKAAAEYGIRPDQVVEHIETLKKEETETPVLLPKTANKRMRRNNKKLRI